MVGWTTLPERQLAKSPENEFLPQTLGGWGEVAPFEDN